MEILKQVADKEPAPRDISHEFLTMSYDQFADFLDTTGESPVSIIIDWKDVATANALKAFIENGFRAGQKRIATIRATEEQKNQANNAFESGLKWEKV